MARSQTFATLSTAIDGRRVVAPVIRPAVACPLCGTTQQGTGYAICPDCYRANGNIFTTQPLKDDFGQPLETVAEFRARQRRSMEITRSAHYEPFPIVYHVAALAELGKPRARAFIAQRAQLKTSQPAGIEDISAAWPDRFVEAAHDERFERDMAFKNHHTGSPGTYGLYRIFGGDPDRLVRTARREPRPSTVDRPRYRQYDLEIAQYDPYAVDFDPTLTRAYDKLERLKEDSALAYKHQLADAKQLSKRVADGYAFIRRHRKAVHAECKRGIAPIDLDAHEAQIASWLETLKPSQKLALGTLPDHTPASEKLPFGGTPDRSTTEKPDLSPIVLHDIDGALVLSMTAKRGQHADPQLIVENRRRNARRIARKLLAARIRAHRQPNINKLAAAWGARLPAA